MKEFPPSPQVESLIVAGLKGAIAADLPGAVETFSRALAEARATGPLAEASAAQMIAQACADIQLASMACEYYVLAAKAARKSGDKEFISIFCGNAGKALFDNGSPELAIDYFKDAAAAYELTGDPTWHAQMLTTWGCALEDLKNFREARAKHAEAGAILEESPDPEYGLLSDICSNQANACARDGQGPDALALRRRAMNAAILSGDADRLHARMDYLAFDLRKFVPETTDADIAGEFGAVYYHSGFLEPAAAYFEQAIASSKSEARQADLLEALCEIQNGLGQTDRAIDAGTRCLRLCQGLKDAASEARISGRLGNLYFSQHRWDEAEGYYQNQMSSAVRAGDTEQRAAAFGDLGAIALLRGLYAKAIEFLTIQKTEARDEYLRANATSGLGAAYIALGAPGRAAPLLEEARGRSRRLADPGRRPPL
jgi:tetratricopeptide (TPR) repeat protein